MAGAVSRLSGVFAAAAVAIVVVLFAPLARYIPKAALAGILLVTAAGLVLDSYASGGKWVAAANELVFALVGLAFVVWGSPQVRAIAGGALGFLGLGVGLSTIPVFCHGIVLSVLPSTLARLTVVVTISAGAAATAVHDVAAAAADRGREPDGVPARRKPADGQELGGADAAPRGDRD